MADEAANDEEYVRLSFKDRFGVDLRKIPVRKRGKRKDPTPDFELLAGAARAAVVEVKRLQETPRTPPRTPEKNEWRLLPGGGMERMDKGPPRVAADIHKAWKQLQTSEAPKILVFVNDEPLLDMDDLVEALRGFMDYGSEETGYYRNDLSSQHSAVKRIQETGKKIDLYVWMDRHHRYFRGAKAKDDAPRFCLMTEAGFRLAREFFRCPDRPRDGA